jgi:hypothetical protein
LGARAPTAAQPQAAPPRLEVDDSKVVASYANFCRVTGTPEEMIIDFGLTSQPFEVPTEPIAVSQRIITNFFTAKRMLYALQMSIQRHEATFGALEIDVQKRVRPAAGR